MLWCPDARTHVRSLLIIVITLSHFTAHINGLNACLQPPFNPAVQKKRSNDVIETDVGLV